MGWLLTPWAIASYIVLAAVLVGMYAVGAGFYYPLRETLAPKDGSPPPRAQSWRGASTTAARSCWPRSAAAASSGSSGS